MKGKPSLHVPTSGRFIYMQAHPACIIKAMTLYKPGEGLKPFIKFSVKNIMKGGVVASSFFI